MLSLGKQNMVMNIQATKLELIKMIMDIENEQMLSRLKNFINQTDKKEKLSPSDSRVEEPEPEWLEMAKQPAPASIDLDDLAKNQGYDAQKLKMTFDNWDYSLFEDESLDELLNSLTK
jgi:hypothetical protein